jgi:hypothetical protein
MMTGDNVRPAKRKLEAINAASRLEDLNPHSPDDALISATLTPIQI